MSTTNEHQLLIKIAGMIDKSFGNCIAAANNYLSTTVRSVNSDFARLDREFERTMGLGTRTFEAIASAAAVAATAMGTFTAAAINAGMEYESQMSTVRAISGANAEQFALLEEKARELGKASAFGATETGEAMEYMAMAGWQTEQILAGIGGVMDLAAASGEELALVSDIVTDGLTAFNMEAEETARMVDVMAQAAANSNTNIEMLGETFKYVGPVAGAMGYQIEDVTIAAGLMANSGIKASNAGTALRKIISRMTKETSESAEAMEALGLSIERDDGSMYSFLEIMEKMRESMAGMAEAEKAYYAAELGGQTGMPGVLAIANATEEQFQQLAEAVYNAENAAQQMADIRLDNLSGDVLIFKNTLADAEIELSEQLNGPLRQIVQMGTEGVDKIAAKIPRTVQKISAEFPTLQRKYKKFAQPVLSGILSGGEWIIKHGDGITSTLAGIGASMAAYKGASGIVHAVNSLMSLGSLNPVTLGIMGAVTAVGALTGAFVACEQQERKLIDQNLARHFGNISLSMEELQQVAEYIVSTDSLGGVRKALEAFEGLEQYVTVMEDTVTALDKMDWKVTIGMDLTEEEQGSYQREIAEYVQAAQDYALQGQYAVSLNLDAVFDYSNFEHSEIVDAINLFYSNHYEELESLGKQLNDAVTEAFNDGLLEIDEIETIRNLRKQIAELEKELALGEYEAELSSLQLDYSGKSLDAETFQNLMAAAGEVSENVEEAYREQYKQTYSAETAAYRGGYLNDRQYQQAIEQAARVRDTGIAESQLKELEFLTGSVMDAYGEGIAQWQQNVEEILALYADPVYADSWETAPESMWNAMMEDIYGAGPDKETKATIGRLMETISERMEELDILHEQWDTLDPETQKLLQELEGEVQMLEGVTAMNGHFAPGAGILPNIWGTSGDTESANLVAAGKILESDVGGFMAEYAQAYYNGLTEHVFSSEAEAYENQLEKAKVDVIHPATENLYAYAEEYLRKTFSGGFQVKADVEIALNSALRYKHRIPPQGLVLDGLNIDENADGGFIWNKELSWLAEEGPEAVIPLNGSRNAISLWEKTGKLLGMKGAFDDIDLSGGSETVTIEYNPTLSFYGGAPTKEDITDALHMSQDEFDSMMERYLRTHSRTAF